MIDAPAEPYYLTRNVNKTKTEPYYLRAKTTAGFRFVPEPVPRQPK